MIQIGDSRDPFQRIKEVVKNMRYLTTLPDNGSAFFQRCGFARPISLVPLSAIAYSKDLIFGDIPEYCEHMDFPYGQEVSGFTTNGTTYVPLTRADLKNLQIQAQEAKLRELSDKYTSLLQRNIITDQEFLQRIGKDVFALLISEMVDNINEHANANNAFIHSQFWPANNSCEICLVDNGIGFYNSLVKADKKVKNNIEAMKRVINERLSAKDKDGSQMRGTGIMNTINLLSNQELKGYFCIISNDAGYFINSEGKRTFLNLQELNWNGTIVNMGFKKPVSKFNIYEHIR